jgi:hypothetical protein
MTQPGSNEGTDGRVVTKGLPGQGTTDALIEYDPIWAIRSPHDVLASRDFPMDSLTGVQHLPVESGRCVPLQGRVCRHRASLGRSVTN